MRQHVAHAIIHLHNISLGDMLKMAQQQYHSFVMWRCAYNETSLNLFAPSVGLSGQQRVIPLASVGVIVADSRGVGRADGRSRSPRNGRRIRTRAALGLLDQAWANRLLLEVRSICRLHARQLSQAQVMASAPMPLRARLYSLSLRFRASGYLARLLRGLLRSPLRVS